MTNHLTNSTANLLNPVKAARHMNLSVGTLARMRGQGTGPAFIKLGRGKNARVVYRLADIETWMDAHRYQNTGEYGAK